MWPLELANKIYVSPPDQCKTCHVSPSCDTVETHVDTERSARLPVTIHELSPCPYLLSLKYTFVTLSHRDFVVDCYCSIPSPMLTDNV